MDKLYSSPLHYPGGKRWLFPILADILPPFKEMVSPFFGGGSIELNFAARGKYISGYDIDPALVNFWQYYLQDAEAVENAAKEKMMEYLTDQKLLVSQKRIEESCEYNPQHRVYKELYFYRAVYYYIFNRLSIYGLTYNTKFVKDYLYDIKKQDFFYTTPMNTRRVFPPMNRMRLIEYPYLKINIETQDYEKTLTENKHVFTYCDPPYYNNEHLYTFSTFHEKFHEKLAEILKARDNWVLSYNDVPFIHELYAEFGKKSLEMTSGFRRQGKRKKNTELLIFSDDIYDYILEFQPQQQQLII